MKDQHPRLDWAAVVAHIVEDLSPSATNIPRIQENLSAHKTSARDERLPPERACAMLDTLEFVFPPTHGA